MRRWLLFLSLLGVIVSGLIWFGSCWREVAYVGNRSVIGAEAGAIGLLVLRSDLPIDGGIPWMEQGWQVEKRRREHMTWLPSLHQDDPLRSTFTVWLTVPLWIPTLCCAVLAIFFWKRSRCRSHIGLCRCGYDLTGNVSGVCPECGREVAQVGRT